MSHCLESKVSDFMVRSPVCAELWQPLAFIRQQMLANSFSYLPVLEEDEKLTDGEEWCVVSDNAIAIYLGPERDGSTRKERLGTTLKNAREEGLTVLKPVKTFEEKATVKDALDHFKAEHVLLVRGPTRGSLLGILTAFDLL